MVTGMSLAECFEVPFGLENQRFEWEKTFTQEKQLSFGSWRVAQWDS